MHTLTRTLKRSVVCQSADSDDEFSAVHPGRFSKECQLEWTTLHPDLFSSECQSEWARIVAWFEPELLSLFLTLSASSGEVSVRYEREVTCACDFILHFDMEVTSTKRGGAMLLHDVYSYTRIKGIEIGQAEVSTASLNPLKLEK
ncbi:hypothetical protein HPB48_014100 [Haemaphysalis longicornis]|uniref:Uncharacterized protein n=1 Tax=Haemaphysalis longicornis TaxID=44386 RepID=A0A9J6FA39_HAELO|nr:hypothetical protein HPB48_014100 [Haemaphysalis longicornis]